MNMMVSIIVNEFIIRLVSHFIQTYQKHTRVDEKIRKLQYLLLRIHAVVEEAEGRDITNQHIQQQLRRFLGGLYRGYYMLDTFRCRYMNTTDKVNNSFTCASLFNPAKRIRMIADNAKLIASGDSHCLQSVLEALESIVADMQEFCMLLSCYPRRPRQIYSTYIQIQKCLFCRQMEKEQIINFLLQAELPRADNLNICVLPIVGRPGIGKRTLVENVFRDERVCKYFSHIIDLDGDDLENGLLSTERVRHGTAHNYKFQSSRSLLVVEFASEVDMNSWRRLYSYACKCMEKGSKIILVSTLEEVANLGTVDPIRLNPVSEEAYWYFFKALAFGSANPDEHPQLVCIAMEIAKLLQRGFIGANLYGAVLRANVNLHFWSRVLTIAKELILNGRFYFWILKGHKKRSSSSSSTRGRYLVEATVTCRAFDFDTTCSPPRASCAAKKSSTVDTNNQHKPTFSDILHSRTVVIPPRKEFDVVVWNSSLPPYSNYVATCVRNTKPKSRQ
ncbi:hypothetical protein ACP4OV_020416 [Aristida adscensionis]